tara:strand:+ start:2828 stop:3364 length:537 start_codon:yes stop_codon:yes gene_type:complete
MIDLHGQGIDMVKQKRRRPDRTAVARDLIPPEQSRSAPTEPVTVKLLRVDGQRPVMEVSRSRISERTWRMLTPGQARAAENIYAGAMVVRGDVAVRGQDFLREPTGRMGDSDWHGVLENDWRRWRDRMPLEVYTITMAIVAGGLSITETAQAYRAGKPRVRALLLAGLDGYMEMKAWA